jgi:hypothetical protein
MQGIRTRATAQATAHWVAIIGYAGVLGFKSVFLQALRELGYIEGRDFDIIYRSSGGNQDRLPALAAELVPLKPDDAVAV